MNAVSAMTMAAGSMLVLAGCVVVPDTAPTQLASASGSPGASASSKAGEKEDPIICMVDDMTATRVRSLRICKPASAWDRDALSAQNAADSFQNKGSTAPVRER